MANQSFRANLVAGSNEITALTPPYASCTYAQITAANAVLNTNRWERLYNASPTSDQSLKITGEHSTPLIEGEEKEYYSGRVRQPRNYRRAWQCTSQPIYYTAVAYPDWDTDDIESFVQYFIRANYLWVNFYTPRMTSSDYIPVAVREWSVTHNDKTGTKRISFTLVHAFQNL